LKVFLHSLNDFFENAPDLLLKHRLFVLMSFVLISAVLIFGMVTRFQMDMSLESWFQEDDPTKITLDRFRQQFGSDDGIYIVYETEDGDVFSEKSINTLQQFHEELDDLRLGITDPENEKLQMLRRIIQIDSLYNARYQLADGDTLISQKLLSSDFPKTQFERELKKEIALGQRHLRLSFYSEDFHYGGMLLKTDFGVVPKETEVQEQKQDLLAEDDFVVSDDFKIDESVSAQAQDFKEMSMDEYLHFMTALRLIAGKPEYSHFKFHFTGNGAMMEFAMNNMAQASVLMSLMLLTVVVLLWFLFKSLSAVFWPVLVITFSAFWSIGFLSLIGVTLSTMVSLTFMLILAVGTADCVHVLSAYLLYRQHDNDHRSAMRKAYRKTGVPIFLTTITTMAGMSALMISDIPQIAVFGLNSALGVAVAFILTVFLLPVLLDIYHPFSRKAEKKLQANRELANKDSSGRDHQEHVSRLQKVLNALPELVGKRKFLIVVVYFALFGSFIYGTTQVKIDSNLIELAKEDSPIRITYQLVDEHMMGGQSLEFMLNMNKRDAFKNVEVLQAVEDFTQHLHKTYPDYVLKTFSLADFVKDTHKIMQGGDASFETIPDDSILTAQLLYLFDNANAEDRRNIVNDDYSISHISIQLKNKGSYEYTHFFEQVQQDLEDQFAVLKPHYPNMEVSVTGALALMMELIDHISWTQIQSFSFALLIITLLMMVSLGSVQAGLISMVPNLLPAFFTFGVMGLLGIPLDTDTLIIAPLIIGIAVDDTIHFIAHYRDAWYESGDVNSALHSTLKEVGQAVTFTTIILGIGFSMLAFSDYMGLAKTGIFGSLSIVIALTSDLLLLPALISWLKPDLGRKEFLEKKAQKSELLT
jgi:predicted RND superfamily exporter protein